MFMLGAQHKGSVKTKLDVSLGKAFNGTPLSYMVERR